MGAGVGGAWDFYGSGSILWDTVVVDTGHYTFVKTCTTQSEPSCKLWPLVNDRLGFTNLGSSVVTNVHPQCKTLIIGEPGGEGKRSDVGSLRSVCFFRKPKSVLKISLSIFLKLINRI